MNRFSLVIVNCIFISYDSFCSMKEIGLLAYQEGSEHIHGSQYLMRYIVLSTWNST